MSLAESIKAKRRLLTDESFFVVDMDLSNEEQECLLNIKIEKELEQFDYYGSDGSKLETDLFEYFTDVGDNTALDISCISQLITRLSKDMIEGFEEESVWIMVRVFMPNNAYDIPRWHHDGNYFKTSKKVYKFVSALRGPQTLFAEKIDAKRFSELLRKNSDNYIENIIKNNNPEKFKTEDLKIRRELIETVKEINICKEGQVVIYLVGDEKAAIHSEPKMNTPRIFISILPGSKTQIDEWKNRKSKK